MGVVNLGILIKKLSNVFLRKDESSTYLSTAGFVKNTDYATSTTGGVVKISANYASALTASGGLMSANKTLEQYSSSDNRMFVSKGTLENVIQTLVKRELITLLGGLDADASGTTLTGWTATKGDDWTISATKT